MGGGNDREPWVKVKIGLRRSSKLADLPSDAARLGWVYALLEAKTQRRLGVFDTRGHFVEVLGRFGRYLPDYVSAGLLHPAAELCADCAEMHPLGSFPPSGYVVHDYLREQRDVTHASRQAAYRERQSRTNEAPKPSPRDGDVTVDVTPATSQSDVGSDGNVTATVTLAHARAERQGQGLRRRRTTEISKVTPTSGTPRANGKGPAQARDDERETGPTLSRSELDEWRGFGSEWNAVKAAWLDRGFRHPPTGEATDDAGDSQRAVLWSVLDTRPRDLPRWIRGAPKGASARDVVAHVLREWHALRADLGETATVEEQPGWMGGPSRDEAKHTLEHIGTVMSRMAGDAQPEGKA